MKNFGKPAESASLLFWITQRRSFMPGRCSLLSLCSTGVMLCEASVDTSPVRHTFLKFAAAVETLDLRLASLDVGDAANSACGSQKVRHFY